MKRKHIDALQQYRKELISSKNEIDSLLDTLKITRLNAAQRNIVEKITSKVRRIK